MNYLAIDIGGTFIKYAVITENWFHPGKRQNPYKTGFSGNIYPVSDRNL